MIIGQLQVIRPSDLHLWDVTFTHLTTSSFQFRESLKSEHRLLCLTKCSLQSNYTLHCFRSSSSEAYHQWYINVQLPSPHFPTLSLQAANKNEWKIFGFFTRLSLEWNNVYIFSSFFVFFTSARELGQKEYFQWKYLLFHAFVTLFMKKTITDLSSLPNYAALSLWLVN